jgi:hypothetical protein
VDVRSVMLRAAGRRVLVGCRQRGERDGSVPGLLVAAGRANTDRPPTLGYWLALGGGLTLALLIVAATLPLLDHLTSLDSIRFE